VHLVAEGVQHLLELLLRRVGCPSVDPMLDHLQVDTTR
jgi:hypothetical protein